MPPALIYLGVMLAVICIWFIIFKRPVYEAVFISFITIVAISNTWTVLPTVIKEALSTPLLYSMISFVAMSQLLEKNKVIDNCLAIILSVLGRIPGGAGYVSVIASAFMGALSGSGPGNVMATGSITIPAMKKSGFPPELAANVESNASYLGNMIPPSANIVAALGAYTAFCPDSTITTGQFWVVLWGVSIWFVLQRVLTLFGFCLYYKVKPMAKEDLPSFKESLKKGWTGLLLPIIIIGPFILDSLFKESFFTERLGDTGAKYMSSGLLLFIAGVASVVALLIAKNKKELSPHKIAMHFSKGVKSLAPAIATCIFGYMIGELFATLNVSEELTVFISQFNLSKFGVVIFISLLTCFLGMVIPGSSLVVTFGAAFIAMFASVGVDPLLAAAMLPCICGVMCGITPPLALGMYAGMSIANSDFSKTVKNDLWWVAIHYILEVVVLMGWLPIIGL